MRSEALALTVRLEIAGIAPGREGGAGHFNGGKSAPFLAVAEEAGGKLVYESKGKAVAGPALPAGQKEIYLRARAGFDDRVTYQYSLNGRSWTAARLTTRSRGISRRHDQGVHL